MLEIQQLRNDLENVNKTLAKRGLLSLSTLLIPLRPSEKRFRH